MQLTSALKPSPGKMTSNTCGSFCDDMGKVAPASTASKSCNVFMFGDCVEDRCGCCTPSQPGGDLVKAVECAWTPVHFDWFDAKDIDMFGDIVPIDQKVIAAFNEKFPKEAEAGKAALDTIQDIAKAKGRKTGQSVSKMTNLVDLRSKFMCKNVFQEGAVTTCMHEGSKALDVKIPATIPAAGGMAKAITFTKEQQKCTASAQGSVTSLSDLDFTASCFERKGEHDTAYKKAKDEMEIAEKLTTAIQDMTGHGPGILFDTNFYTDTYRYSKFLAPQECAEKPMPGLAMGLYAVARGLHAIDSYALRCKSEDGGRQCASPIQTAKFTGIHSNDIGEIYHGLTSTLKTYAESGVEDKEDELNKYYSMIESERDYKGESRTSVYFQLLDKTISAAQDTKNKDFCIMNSFALILANEAYWNSGAIKQVLQRGVQLNYHEGAQAIFMNLGYAMEHLVHEMIKGDDPKTGSQSFEGTTYGTDFEDVTMANYGDGLIKFGKYMDRAIKALQGIHMYNVKEPPFNDATIMKPLKQGKSFIELKDWGKGLEKRGNPMGLPEAYVLAYTLSPREKRCDLFHGIAHMVHEVFEHLLKNYPTE